MKRDGKPVLDVHAFRGLLWKFLGDDWPLEQKRELFNVFNDALLEYQWKRKPDIIFRSQRLSGRVVDLCSATSMSSCPVMKRIGVQADRGSCRMNEAAA